MSVLRTIGVVVLGVLLTVTLLAGNVVFAAHQTVLDPGYVSGTIEEEAGYESLTEELTGQLAPDGQGEGNASEEDVSAADGPGGLVSPGMMTDLVTPEYVQSQVEGNVDRFYAYLHGARDDPGLRIDLVPIKDGVGEAVEERVREREPHELVAMVGGQGGGGDQPPVDADLVARLDEGPESYQAAKTEFRADVRDQVVERMVDEQFARASNDELLSLVVEDYDPDEYSEREKERMVAEREGEIRAALAERTREENGDEVDARVEDAMSEMRDRAGESPAGGEGENETVAAAAGDLRESVVVALTTDASYDTYRAESTAARDDLAVALGNVAGAQVDQEMPDEMALTDGLDQQQREGLETAATAVQWVDRLAVVLPVVAVALVGLVWYATRSVGRTAGTAGWSLLAAGVPSYAGGEVARSMLAEELPGEMPAVLLRAMVDGFIATVQGQALWLVLLGCGLVAWTLAKRYDLVERAVGGSAA